MTKQEAVFAAQIKALKPTKVFVVKTSNERRKVLNLANIMRRCGQIDFDVVSREDETGGFKIGAI